MSDELLDKIGILKRRVKDEIAKREAAAPPAETMESICIEHDVPLNPDQTCPKCRDVNGNPFINHKADELESELARVRQK